MPDVPALFNSASCCAVRMPIPHGVSLTRGVLGGMRKQKS
ncbi:hypothetical protein RHECNPAF_1340015 [Rhizobium etli CNPAF512]|nr:hypothetical protein RHECNPAF_1340015 [Rhizobium etli CNPAF512]